MQSVHVTTNVVSSNPAQVRCTLYKLCDKVFQSLATCQWFSPGTPVSSTNKTGRHDISEEEFEDIKGAIRNIVKIGVKHHKPKPN
jgi:hypothetical protein